VRRAGAVVLALAALGATLAACGVKAPPRPPGAPEKATPQDVLRPVQEPRR
jgi:predicted small lipoprotein YifL